MSFILTLFLSFTISSEAHAAPSSPLSAVSIPAANESFLRDQDIDHLPGPLDNLRNELLDPGFSRDMRFQYEQMVREMDLRTAYDQMDTIAQASYMDRSRNMCMHIMRTLMSQGIQNSVRAAEKNSPAVRQFRHIEATVQNIMQNSSSLEVGPAFKIGTMTHIPNQKGSIWLENNAIGRLSLDLSLGQSWEELQNPEKRQNEFYKVQYGTHIAGLSPEISFGGSSTRITAKVTRELLPGLSSEVSAIRSLDDTKSGLPQGRDEQIRLNFQRTF